MCIVLKICVLGVFYTPNVTDKGVRFSTLKCVFRIPVQFPLSKYFTCAEELQHLARQTLLMEHVAGGIVAYLCDITIYLLF